MIKLKSIDELEAFLEGEDLYMLALLYSKMFYKFNQNPFLVQKWFTTPQSFLGNISPIRMIMIGELEALYVNVMQLP